ncbi:hypothetical protein TNCV_3243421 [Trichonephila clavipes]|nr:hypothetical protein TNCV_3243421 [Trichonephila clavipes]
MRTLALSLSLRDELMAANSQTLKNWKELFWKSGTEYPTS